MARGTAVSDAGHWAIRCVGNADTPPAPKEVEMQADRLVGSSSHGIQLIIRESTDFFSDHRSHVRSPRYWGATRGARLLWVRPY
jgi:hypothetical protein